MLWNLYRHDDDKWLFERPHDDIDLDEIFRLLTMDRVVFEYLDDNYSTHFFKLDKVHFMTAESIRAADAVDFLVRRGVKYIQEVSRM